MALRGWRLYVSLLALGAGTAAFAQQPKVDLDKYYRFPFSLGVDFQQLTPFNDYAPDFNTTVFSVNARVPIPSAPILQPLVRLGMANWDYVNLEDPEDRWQHQHWFGQLGLGYSGRFSKDFELGVSAAAGLSQAIFPNLDKDPVTGDFTPRGNLYLLATVLGKLSLDPAYSISIDVEPSLSYQRSFTPLTRFDGLAFGLGIGVNYRFGQDPDAPQAIIRSLRIGDAEIPPLFAAMQSYYVSNPIAVISITNVETFAIRDLEVAFFQEGFMDSPTQSAKVRELAPGKSVDVKLFAAFNAQVFSTQGVTPLNGEIRTTYTARNRSASQAFPVTYDLYDKSSITWDDDRKVAAYVTPADSALRNFTSYVRQACKDVVIPGLSEPLQVAMQLYYALKELGVIYQVDPTSPFDSAQKNARLVDSVSLPRETLRRATGDCDDLTALFAALLESVGVETGFITTPGHIYPMLNTKVPSREFALVHPEQRMAIDVDGELWVPVETTLLAKEDFLGAWRYGIDVYRQYDADTKRRGVYLTREAQKVFRPVGLRETDAGIIYPRAEPLAARVSSSVGSLIDAILAAVAAKAQGGNRRDLNNLGIAASRLGRYEVAERAFSAALAQDRNYTAAMINLGNVYYLQGRFQDALRSYHRAERTLAELDRGGSSEVAAVLLNISRSYYKLENYDRAREYLTQLTRIDSALADQNAYLSERAAAGR